MWEDVKRARVSGVSMVPRVLRVWRVSSVEDAKGGNTTRLLLSDCTIQMIVWIRVRVWVWVRVWVRVTYRIQMRVWRQGVLRTGDKDGDEEYGRG